MRRPSHDIPSCVCERATTQAFWREPIIADKLFKNREIGVRDFFDLFSIPFFLQIFNYHSAPVNAKAKVFNKRVVTNYILFFSFIKQGGVE